MASILKVDTITGVTTAGSIAITGEGNSTTTNLQQGLIKGWSHLDGSQAAASMAQDSFNLSSMTDNGSGDYTFALSSVMASVSHSTTADGDHMSNGHLFLSVSVYTTSGARILTRNDTNAAATDASNISVQTSGDLA
mgnify:CR=1 FL=1